MSEQSRRKGETYEAGIAFGCSVVSQNMAESAGVGHPICGSCGLLGHSRRSHKLCPMNKRNTGILQTPS